MTVSPVVLEGSVAEHHDAFLDELDRLKHRLRTLPATLAGDRDTLARHVEHAHEYSTARRAQPLRAKIDHATAGLRPDTQVEWDAALVQSAHAAVQRGDVLAPDGEHPLHDGLWTRIRNWVLEHSMPAFHMYEDFDRRWLKALAERIATPTVPFPATEPASIEIAEKVRIAIVGDWGTGLPESDLIAAHVVTARPDYIVHLGDVYYAGTPDEERRFLEHWPGEPGRSLTLNSNHEMYGGGQGYFGVLLPSDTFRLQNRCSYFAMHNEHFLILGLDTAYHAESLLYEDGKLDEEKQLPFIRDQVERARVSNVRIIVLTHHNGLDLENKKTKLWNQLRPTIPGPFTWIWGHLHAGVVHRDVDGVSGRCVGHGGVPYSPFTAEEEGRHQWAERQLANDAREPNRALNGYYILELEGGELCEAFCDERGRPRWATPDE